MYIQKDEVAGLSMKFINSCIVYGIDDFTKVDIL